MDWHIDAKGKFSFPKRKGGKFASKKVKPATKQSGDTMKKPTKTSKKSYC